MRRLALAFIVTVAACTGNDPALSGAAPSDAGAANVGGGGDAGGDAAPAAPCDPDKDFAVPTGGPFARNVNTAAYVEEGASLTPDELVVYYATNRADPDNILGFDLWYARRASQTEPFGEGGPLEGFDSTTTSDRWPIVSPDGKQLYFARRVDNGSYDMMHMTRGTDGVWGAPASVPQVATPAGNEIPSAFAGQRLWYWSSGGPPPNGVGVLTFGADNVPTASHDGDLAAFLVPVPNADETTLFYAFDNPGRGLDIYTATKTAGRWGQNRALTDLSDPKDADDVPRAISADGCRLYLGRTSRVTSGLIPTSGDLLMAQRPR